MDHGHAPGLFNFYDYFRLLRAWRETIGVDKLMIGHGGGFLVGSDMIEAFDACLTGEAQETLDPSALGIQFGTVPTLWTLQRRKRDIFRSAKAIEQMIRQGVTPHIGIGISGSAVVATLDPANHPAAIALWQMWRGFPVHNARFYNYFDPDVLTLDNNEIVYSLYVTDHQQVLLIMANEGGSRCDDAPAIGVNIQLNLDALQLPARLKCWRMKGDRYETFRIQEVESVRDGKLTVPELDLHEFVGFVLSPDEPPEELSALIKHLEGRPERSGRLQEGREQRLKQADQLLDSYAKLPNANIYFSYRHFMSGRIAE